MLRYMASLFLGLVIASILLVSKPNNERESQAETTDENG
jgi:hypothetical protein